MVIATVAALGLAGPAFAHDFWMRADRFQAPGPDARVRLRFEINEATTPEPWDLQARRIVSLVSVGPEGIADQQAGVAATGEDGHADVSLRGAGTHLVAFESTQAVSDLPAVEFDPYVAEEGLSAIARARGPAPAGNGREVYARRAKALVQVGSARTDAVTRPIGHTLEIVPLKNPYGLAAEEALEVRVLFRGRPLEGATVHIARLSPQPKDGVSTALTGADGRARLAFPKAGAWKVVAVWGEPVAGEPAADFQTIFASLTFGY